MHIADNAYISHTKNWRKLVFIYRDNKNRRPEYYDFKVPEPTLLYNRGEIYNLSIRRGTLTEEDRYKINEHNCAN